jgi:hypothetical protein
VFTSLTENVLFLSPLIYEIYNFVIRNSEVRGVLSWGNKNASSFGHVAIVFFSSHLPPPRPFSASFVIELHAFAHILSILRLLFILFIFILLYSLASFFLIVFFVLLIPVHHPRSFSATPLAYVVEKNEL